ncbi:MAG: hypothetical protein ACJAUQ_002028 [Maribacter sp.]|jgi:hypothetical protein
MKEQKQIQMPTDFTSFVYRMDRSYSDLLKLQRKLNSYSYEPNTYSQYKAKAILIQKLTVVIAGHIEVLSSIKHKIWNVKQGLSKIRFQLSAAKALDEAILAYMLERGSYS